MRYLKIVVKNERIIATHKNDQFVEDLYEGASILLVPMDVVIPESGLVSDLNMTSEQQQKSDQLQARFAKITEKMAGIATKTPAQIDNWLDKVFSTLPQNSADAKTWIDTNVTDLPSAKTAMKKIVDALYEQREASRKIAQALLAVVRKMDWSD